MDRKMISAAALALSVAVGGTSFAQQADQAEPAAQQQQRGQGQGQGQSSQQLDPDKLFIMEAGVHGMYELQLSQLAQQQAQNPEVKKFAERMVKDHTKANEELQQLATKVGAKIPQQLPRMKQQEMQMLQGLQGQEFDQCYMSAMKAAHAMDVSKFEDKAKMAKNEELKTWTAGKVPTLKEHYHMVIAMMPGSTDTTQAQPAGSTQPPSSGDHGAGGTSGGGGASSGGGGAGSK